MKLEDLLNYLESLGISKKILEAFKEIKREWFVPEKYKDFAYYDEVVPLFDDVTISQPYVLALMLDELEILEELKILEIGTGSGFSTALLSYLVGRNGKIISIEINEKAYKYATLKLEDLVNKKIISKNFEIILGNGYYGYEKYKPYDRIICHAAVEKIPKYWLNQIENGIIVSPVGKLYQKLMKYKIENGIIVESKHLLDVVFVNLKI
ncbi:MAG: protein-L-isoaspartate O-methyltransferase [Nanopusillaceae archaeon]